MGFPFGVKEKFWNWRGMMAVRPCERTKCYRVVQLKRVSFMLLHILPQFLKSDVFQGHISLKLWMLLQELANRP